MKFLFIMLAIRFLFDLLDKVGKNEKVEINSNGFAKYPAEFQLR